MIKKKSLNAFQLRLALYMMILSACTTPSFSPIETKQVVPTNTISLTQEQESTPTPAALPCTTRSMFDPDGYLFIERTIENMGLLTYLYMYDLTNNHWTQLAEGGLFDAYPSLSHDHQKLVHVFNSNNNDTIISLQELKVNSSREFIFNEKQEILLITQGYIFSDPVWSDNDEWIAFALSAKNLESRIMILNVFTRKYYSINSESKWNDTPKWLNGGREIIFLGGNDRWANNVYKISLEEVISQNIPSRILHKERLLFDEASLNKEGMMLLTAYNNDNTSAIIQLDVETENIVVLLQHDQIIYRNPKWMNDNQLFAYNKIEKTDTAYTIALETYNTYTYENNTIYSGEMKTPGINNYVWSEKEYIIAYVRSEQISNSNNSRYWLDIIKLNSEDYGTEQCSTNKIELGPYKTQRFVLHDWIYYE